MSIFADLHPSLQETLITGLGWNELRPIQELAYAAVSEGLDVLILAPTAGGKTEAAFLPVIDRILKKPTGHLSAIYISPLKALINDQIVRVLSLVRRAGLEPAVQHGDVSASERFDFSQGEPDILLTTPESLEVLLSNATSREAFRHLRYIIVDEIHAFIETARGVQLKCLIDRITSISTLNPVRIGLSATVGNPDELLAWYSAPERRQKLVLVPSPAAKKRISFRIEPELEAVADVAADAVRGKKALVFVDSRSVAERLYKPLSERLSAIYLHHSAVSADDRRAAEQSFSSDTGTCVICTSTMELGIDIGDLDLAVNIGPPQSVASFLQRLGRCGRRGIPAEMLFIVHDVCELMIAVATVESAARHQSESLHPRQWSCDVLIQQLFSMVRTRQRLGEKEIVRALCHLSSFANLDEDHIRRIIEHLVMTGYLVHDGPLLMLGDRTEKEFGHAHWKALISVLSDTGGYTAVLPDGTVVGMLDPRFVSGDPGKVFTFTGRTWRLLFRDDVHRRVLIEPSLASKGLKRPFWSSNGAVNRMSRLVVESCAMLISRGHSMLPLPKETADILEDFISSLPPAPEPETMKIRIEPELKEWDVVVSTFAGDAVNRTLTLLLKTLLKDTLDFHTTPFGIRICGFPVKEDCDAVSSALYDLKNMPYAQLLLRLPAVPDTVWKFGSLLPEDIKKEMAGAQHYMLDAVCNLVQKI